jgi:branched-chain amino acid transport system substrate-binding protein
MRQHRWAWVVALLAATTLVASACGDDDDDGGASGDETTTTAGEAAQGDGVLKVGSLLPSTGTLSFLGPPMIGGVEMAVKEINDAGGVLGKDVELVEQDDGTDPDVASPAADNLLADDVDVIVGAAASGVSLAVLDKITGTPVVQCSPSNTGLQFTTVDDGGFYFRTAPPDNLQAQILADLITGDGHENVAVIAQSTEYGEGFANALADELDAAGATVTPDEPILYDAESGNYQAEATQLADAKPDAIAIISYEEGAQVMQAAIAAGVGPKDTQWYGADGIQGSSFWKAVDPNNPAIVEGVKGTAPSAAPAGGEATFRERFEAFKPGVDTIYSGHAYDCVVVAALAAIAADSDAPEAIQKEMNNVTKEGEKCTLFKDCVALLKDGKDIDYDGAAGPLDFIDAGEPGSGEYDTWTFDAAGKVQTIEASIPVEGEKD